MASVGNVVLTHGEEMLALAEDAGAFAEGALFVLLDLEEGLAELARCEGLGGSPFSLGP